MTPLRRLRRPFPLLLVALLLFAALLPSLHAAMEAAGQRPAPGVPASGVAAIPPELAVGWTEFSRGITEITAAAVSPLLVVSVIGASRYFRTPQAEKSRLPFFCNPLLWGTGLVLLSLCFLKDVLGAALPSPLKKPFDMLELFENKASALVASTLFVPVITWEMTQNFGMDSISWAAQTGTHLASLPFFPGSILDLRCLMVAASVLCFGTVWLTAHFINVLVAICPIGFIDALLKFFKNGVLALLLVSSAIHPYLGGAASLLLLFFAVFVAGTAFRFAVFGTVLALDTLLIWSNRRSGLAEPARVFLSGRACGLPALTYGRLIRNSETTFAFHYRKWPFFARAKVDLPPGIPVLCRDFLSISFLLRTESGAEIKLLQFPPKYARHAETLAAYYQIVEIRDGTVIGGVKMVYQKMCELLGLLTSSSRGTVSQKPQ